MPPTGSRIASLSACVCPTGRRRTRYRRPLIAVPRPSASILRFLGIAPLGVPGTRPPTTEDIQAFVERLGFRRVEDWSDASFGDSFAGLKHQYYRSEHWRLAATGRVRFSTGRWDDPNNLVDFPTGFDTWGLALELHQDVVS